ncbi:unannotated protein [freshwater metagenome]|uniref:Unannotated protein n=1 Tax=freshwater metagenome TaxID=449393 RepID=A0A6J5Z1E0_9ZZZZ
MTTTIDRNSPDLWRHVVSTTNQTHAPISPFPHETIPAFPLSSVADVTTAVQRAREVQRIWALTALKDRQTVMSRFHDIVLGHETEILDVIQRETGKARAHAMDEVLHVAMNAGYLARVGKKVLRTERRAGAFPILTQSKVHHIPNGVVGVISPWNYPFTLAISDALAAIMAGNAVVIKPDLQTVWSAIYAVELLEQAGAPQGLVQIVVGDGPTLGQELVAHVDYICFTGSTRTGRLIATQAAQRLIGAALELGGKNPMIVCADADLDKFVDIAIHSCFTSAGQLCVSTERIYVAQEIYELAVSKLASRVTSLTIKAEMGWGYDIGSLTTSAQHERVVAAINNAVAQGAHVVVGGKSRPDIGPLVVEPTILSHVSDQMDVARQEVFGPCVFISPFETEEQAIALANDSEYGLSGSVITRDVARGRAIATKLKCGSVNVNEGFAATFGSVSAPMGGMGDSGLGRRHGPEGIRRFTQPQTISVQRFMLISRAFGMTDRQWSRFLARSLKLMRALRIR